MLKKKEPLVSIIILNFNGKKFLKSCLNSIKNNTSYKDYKVIVVDNNSTDGSVGMVKKQFKNIDLIQNKKNYGFSKGNNIGIKFALKNYKPKYFFLLNNDTKVTKGWLKNLVRAAESSKEIGIAGCKQLDFEGKPSISAGLILPWGRPIYLLFKNKKQVLKNSSIKKFELRNLNLIEQPTYVIYIAKK